MNDCKVYDLFDKMFLIRKSIGKNIFVSWVILREFLIVYFRLICFNIVYLVVKEKYYNIILGIIYVFMW